MTTARDFARGVNPKYCDPLLAEAERHAEALLDDVRESCLCNDLDDEPKEPYLIESQAEIDGYPPFPFPKLGDYDTGSQCECGNYGQAPVWWEPTRELFCDASGFGRPGEPALTIEQLKAELRPGFAYAITGEGQFQVYVTEYKRAE